MKYLKDLKAYLKSLQQLIRLPLMFTNGGFTRPSSSRSVLMRDIGALYGIATGRAGFTLSSILRPWREKSLSRSVLMRDGAGRMRGYPLGFTLIEILVVVLIIGILGAIMLPQYQRAVLKSRYSGMMPIAKALAEANEVFYLEHGEYSENPADLLVAGRNTAQDGAYPDGTRVLMYDEDGLSYVRVMNDNVPNARYIVYQKHSENFADTTQCEAADDRANELCVALGGELIEEGNSSGESEWTAYLLSGRYGSTDQLIPAGDNNSGEGEDGDEPGAEPEPQTPQCDENDKPADIEPTETNPATGTATCVNGQWKYQWTDNKIYAQNYSTWTVVCAGDSVYKCSGGKFQGKYTECHATQENGCAESSFTGENALCEGEAVNGCLGSTFSGTARCEGRSEYACAETTIGENSTCYGYIANGCANSTISGNQSSCYGGAANGCTGSVVSGDKARCYGQVSNGCAGTTIQAGAYCVAATHDGCNGAKYGEDPTGVQKGIGRCQEFGNFCPNGAPIFINNSHAWDTTNGAYNYTWKGGYCDPSLMVSGNCPVGSPKQGGGCWDGNGNQTSC